MSESASNEWVSIYTTGNDYEAELVCDRLNDAGITAVIRNQRDHAFNLTMGDLASIDVMVQADQEEDALALLDTSPISDSELTRQALAASPLDPSDRTLVELDDEDDDDWGADDEDDA